MGVLDKLIKKVENEDEFYIEDLEFDEDELDEKAYVEDEYDEKEKSDVDKLSEKGKKLLEKVNKLKEKVEDEQNSIKRHVLTFKIRILVSKIQKELDLQIAKEENNCKRKNLSLLKEKNEMESLENIAEITAEIKVLKRKLKANKEYDLESNEFMYPKDYVEKIGGIEALVNKIASKGGIQSIITADKIGEMQDARSRLEELKEELKENQARLSNSDKEFERENQKIDLQERALVVNNKLNIFSKMKNYFGTMIDQAKLYFEERKEDKKAKEELGEKQAKIKAKYEELFKELEAKQKEEEENANNQYKDEQKERNLDRAQDIVAQVEEKINSWELTPQELQKANEPIQLSEEPLDVDQTVQKSEGQEPEN